MGKESEKMAKFEGSWKQVESHGLDEFLAASGIGWMKRKMATKCNPIDQIQISGENLTISYTAVGVISGSNTYKIGGTAKIKNYLDEEVDADCVIEDEEKIVLIMKGGSLGEVRISRVIKDGKLHVEQKIMSKNIVASRVFERS
ncbi:Oidioi.mRNA.OKI2018_I69.PAR.g11308.t1.cds [Oikopleura dioica]|uniref:Oidioi.mRNA.OKI2018_I69.PAR.g11308.t1.cds n=1 Tax=Oikopleura dioica TaxID=34765 RepID=A0ABN7RY75_OIKDI|nr:Oidioi.mRNA.OKI2018_I69.PAR.g11308.t1.cds [Oikopleura dioica]